jgi:hypothetical protein
MKEQDFCIFLCSLLPVNPQFVSLFLHDCTYVFSPVFVQAYVVQQLSFRILFFKSANNTAFFFFFSNILKQMKTRHNCQSFSQYLPVLHLGVCINMLRWNLVVENSLVPFHYRWEVALSNTKFAFLRKINWIKKKNSTEGVSSVQTQIYKLHSVHSCSFAAFIPYWKSCWSWIFEGMIFFRFSNKSML